MIDPTARPSGTGCAECEATGSWWLAKRTIPRDALITLLCEAVWKDPGKLSAFLGQTDMDAVFDLMEVPKANPIVEMK